MSRIAYCPACAAQQHGVKTRIPLEHTCGLQTGAMSGNGKIIISSAQLYKFLSERMEFWKAEVNIVGTGDELIIDGFKGLLCHCKAPFECTIATEKLRQLRRLVGTISDQPITLSMDGLKFEIQSILI